MGLYIVTRYSLKFILPEDQRREDMRHGVIQDRGPGGYRLRTEFRASIQRKATGCIHDRLLVMEDRAMLHIFNFKRESTKNRNFS